MKKTKKIFRKLNIVLVLVLVLSFTFALPCSAKEINKYYNPANRILYATYHVADDLDYGSQRLMWEGSKTIGTMAWLTYSNVPFDIGNDGSNYTIRIEITGLEIGLDNTSEPWTVTTRYAIGNGSAIFSIGDTSIYIESDDGVQRQYLDSKISGNVAYVFDQIDIPTNNTYKFIIEFNFPTTSWSDSSWLYLFGFNFVRRETVQESIDNQTNAILGADGDGTIDDNISGTKDSVFEYHNIEQEIQSMLPQENDILKPNYDIDLNAYIPAFDYLGTCITGTVNSLGIGYNKLFWTLVLIGSIGSLLGIVVMVRRGKD